MFFTRDGPLTVVFNTAGQTGTYTIPAGKTSLQVKMWGGNTGGAAVGTVSVSAGDPVKYMVAGIGPIQTDATGDPNCSVVYLPTTGSYLVAGGGGDFANATNGAGGGDPAQNGDGNSSSGAAGGGGASSSGAGSGGSGGTGGSAGSAGNGPISDWSVFPTDKAGFYNGGHGGTATSGGGGVGGNGYYGGGGGGGGWIDPDEQSAAGGGGSGAASGFSTSTLYTGSKATGLPGNASDPNRPTNAGNQSNSGAIVLILT